jgi:hypothetical protein
LFYSLGSFFCHGLLMCTVKAFISIIVYFSSSISFWLLKFLFAIAHLFLHVI